MIFSCLSCMEFSIKYGSLCMRCQPMAEIIPVNPIPAITLRIIVTECDCKIFSNNLSQIANKQTISAVRRAVLGTETKTDQRQNPNDRRGPRIDEYRDPRTEIQGPRFDGRVLSTEIQQRQYSCPQPLIHFFIHLLASVVLRSFRKFKDRGLMTEF